MNKKIKFLSFFLILLLLTNCSFDNKSGIWSGGKEEKERLAKLEKQQQSIIETIKVYSSDAEFKREIPAKMQAKLSLPQTKNSWKMSGSNLQNFTSHNQLSGIDNIFLKKKNR